MHRAIFHTNDNTVVLTIIPRLGSVEVLKIHQHEDTDDSFEREPFSVLVTDTHRGEGWRTTLCKFCSTLFLCVVL